MSDRLYIFDNATLRDGEQSPGASMTREEKIRIARQLKNWGWISSKPAMPPAPVMPRRFAPLPRSTRNPPSAPLARATENDIRIAGQGDCPGGEKGIHTFIATSPIHMEKKVRRIRIR